MLLINCTTLCVANMQILRNRSRRKSAQNLHNQKLCLKTPQIMLGIATRHQTSSNGINFNHTSKTIQSRYEQNSWKFTIIKRYSYKLVILVILNANRYLAKQILNTDVKIFSITEVCQFIGF